MKMAFAIVACQSSTHWRAGHLGDTLWPIAPRKAKCRLGALMRLDDKYPPLKPGDFVRSVHIG